MELLYASNNKIHRFDVTHCPDLTMLACGLQTDTAGGDTLTLELSLPACLQKIWENEWKQDN